MNAAWLTHWSIFCKIYEICAIPGHNRIGYYAARDKNGEISENAIISIRKG